MLTFCYTVRRTSSLSRGFCNMLKIRILSPRIAGTAAALGGVASALTGCATGTDATVQSSDAVTTAVALGTGQISAGWDTTYTSTSGGDEIIRAGEKMRLGLDYGSIWYVLTSHGSGGFGPSTSLKPADLVVTGIVTYADGYGRALSTVELPLTWAVDAAGVITSAKSDEFEIPAATPVMKIDYRVVEKAAAPLLLSSRFGGTPKSFPIYGAFVPNKEVLFDNAASGAVRERVLEGGALVAGANATIAFADWRADRVVNKVGLDTYIGQRQSSSRFGPTIVDAHAPIEYEIEMAYTTDGTNWQSAKLDEKRYSAALQTQPDQNRRTYEALLGLPATANGLRVAFHVKAFLKVPSFYPGEIINPKYAAGERVQIADKWDNNGGADYFFPTR